MSGACSMLGKVCGIHTLIRLQYVESRGNLEGPERLYNIKRCLNGMVWYGMVWYVLD